MNKATNSIEIITEKREKYIECEICGKPALQNLVICSDKCDRIRKKKIEIEFKYFQPKGCENCLGDLHQGCSKECKKEFEKFGEFCEDMWSLIKIIYPLK